MGKFWSVKTLENLANTKPLTIFYPGPIISFSWLAIKASIHLLIGKQFNSKTGLTYSNFHEMPCLEVRIKGHTHQQNQFDMTNRNIVV